MIRIVFNVLFIICTISSVHSQTIKLGNPLKEKYLEDYFISLYPAHNDSLDYTGGVKSGLNYGKTIFTISTNKLFTSGINLYSVYDGIVESVVDSTKYDNYYESFYNSKNIITVNYGEYKFIYQNITAESAKVKAGDSVKKGDIIAKLFAKNQNPMTKLILKITKSNIYLDPFTQDNTNQEVIWENQPAYDTNFRAIAFEFNSSDHKESFILDYEDYYKPEFECKIFYNYGYIIYFCNLFKDDWINAKIYNSKNELQKSYSANFGLNNISGASLGYFSTYTPDTIKFCMSKNSLPNSCVEFKFINPSEVEEKYPHSSNSLVYPNPFTDILHINSDSNFEYYQIFNNIGEEILYGRINQNQINLQHLATGTYHIRLYRQSNSLYLPIIKQ